MLSMFIKCPFSRSSGRDGMQEELRAMVPPLPGTAQLKLQELCLPVSSPGGASLLPSLLFCLIIAQRADKDRDCRGYPKRGVLSLQREQTICCFLLPPRALRH